MDFHTKNLSILDRIVNLAVGQLFKFVFNWFFTIPLVIGVTKLPNIGAKNCVSQCYKNDSATFCCAPFTN